MVRMAGVLAFALLVAGCATDASVKKQLDPLAARLTAVEQQQAATQAKLDAQATELQALHARAADPAAAARQEAALQDAQQAAKDARAAAEQAEAAAQKSAKAFELSQVKGGKR